MGNRIGKAYTENNPPTVTFDEPNGAAFFLCPDETVLPPYTNPCPQIEVAVSEIPVEYNDCVPCGAITQALIANYIENGPFPNAFTLSVSPSFENYLTSLSALQNLCNFTFHVDGNNAPTIDFAEENGAAYYLCPNETVLPPFTEQITAVSGCLPCNSISVALQNYYLEYGSNATPPTLNALYGVSPELAELNIDFSTYSAICGFTIDFDSNNLPIANWINPTPNTSYFCLGTYTKAPDAGNLAYRYGFNGKENDNEIIGKGRWQDYGMRMYRPDLGRFFSVDPLEKSYPYYTPYQFAGNKVIWAIDLDGAEELKMTNKAISFFLSTYFSILKSEYLKKIIESISDPSKKKDQLIIFTIGKTREHVNSFELGVTFGNVKEMADFAIEYKSKMNKKSYDNFKELEFMSEGGKGYNSYYNFQNWGIDPEDIKKAVQKEVFVVLIDESEVIYHKKSAIKTTFHEIAGHLKRMLKGVEQQYKHQDHYELYDIKPNSKEALDFGLEEGKSPTESQTKPSSTQGKINAEVDRVIY